ncbi:MAG: DUF547 domain-containing protein [candidate division KSB1 bacterium]|nr:DUF547 domain-containing protein [candidate division KSB1 bacterium]
MMRGLLLLLLIVLSAVPSRSAGPAFSHSAFDAVLQEHVQNGLVDYQALTQNRQRLKLYLKQIERVDADSFRQWDRAEQMALWINAYNAITIEGIVRHYPIDWGNLLSRARFPKSSIRQISGFWDKVFIPVMGRDLTLNDIEHNVLRKQYKDPRIHFVLVCASIGCPKLPNRAFTADQLNQQMDAATREFIQNPDKNRLDKQENILYLSSIFKWYKEDFPASAGSGSLKVYGDERGVVEFAADYRSESDRKFIYEQQPKLKYLDYDWSLNDQAK